MSSRILPLIALALALPSRAAEVAPAAPAASVAVSAKQVQALGIVVQPLGQPRRGLASGLPAQVTIPNEQQRVVAAPLAGLVTQLTVAPGQNVKAGQTLARITSPALLAAEREYLQAEQQADLARRAASRDEQLFREGIIAESRWQATKSAADQAVVGATEKRETLRLAGVDPARKKAGPSLEVAVASPLEGVVLEQTATIGQRVDQAAPLYRIARLSPLWLEIQAPAAAAVDLGEGAAVRVAGADASGRVINVGRRIDPGSQTVTVRALIDRGADRLRPGQLVEAEIELARRGQLTYPVPLAALARHQGGTYVFVAERNGFRPVAVTLDGTAGDQAMVRGPLRGDEQIAVSGVASLKATWIGVGKAD